MKKYRIFIKYKYENCHRYLRKDVPDGGIVDGGLGRTAGLTLLVVALDNILPSGARCWRTGASCHREFNRVISHRLSLACKFQS